MSGMVRLGLSVVIGLSGLLAFNTLLKADGWAGSKAPAQYDNELSADGLRQGGIANTRHNLTISYNSGRVNMEGVRNDYYEICVYCHTPHGANSTVAAPLWNRTVQSSVYTVFPRAETMLGQTVTQPGPNSLTCLSCHDGVTAIDSVINMPTRLEGSFRAGYASSQENSVSRAFLDAWASEGNELLAKEGKFTSAAQLGPAGSGSQNHFSLGGASDGCVACHRDGGGTQAAPDFSAFVIGADGIPALNTGVRGIAAGNGSLNDDHPIGVRYPTDFSAGVDFNPPTVEKGRIAFFDRDGDRHADANEVRLYNSGDGYEVECASCHDPHGVPMNYDNHGAPTDGAKMIPSFLRVGAMGVATASNAVGGVPTNILGGNSGSELCLTCHVK
ncbi:MAG: hypothetical protein OEW58_04870 [Gammaproteobacteria bacterium]|nr:hypothetical protein [Gammaproteobacteria bacterium]